MIKIKIIKNKKVFSRTFYINLNFNTRNSKIHDSKSLLSRSTLKPINTTSYFSNECILLKKDKKFLLEVIFRFQLIFCYFKQNKISFSSFYSFFVELKHCFTVAVVLEAICIGISKKHLYLIVYIDKTQKIFEHENAFPKNNVERSIFKQFMYVI